MSAEEQQRAPEVKEVNLTVIQPSEDHPWPVADLLAKPPDENLTSKGKDAMNGYIAEMKNEK